MNGLKTTIRITLIGAISVGIANGEMLGSRLLGHQFSVFPREGIHMKQNSGTQDDLRTATIVGKWYLTDFKANETKVPDHRVDLIFYAEGNGYRGAILSTSGLEIPLASVHFDGVTLRFQMTTESTIPQTEMPWFVATLVSGRFEGYYQNSSNTTVGPKLKLVRFEK
jgi:hypothetical protein